MLFEKFPARLLQLANRMVMVPMTRNRASGRPLLANPGLVARKCEDAPLNTPNRATFYVPGAKGYTDYPTLSTTKEAMA